MQRTRVAVLRGGPSEEYNVSMKTGASVIAALNPEQYEPIDVVITKDGEWLTGGRVQYPEQILSSVDVAFLGLHGAYGEDGTVQKMLERMAVPYTGSSSYPSKIAMHKALTKDHLRDVGILLAPHMLIRSNSGTDFHKVSDSIGEMFGPEYIVKPVASGSSIGAAVAKNRAMLPSVLRNALETYDEVIVEKRIRGKEATCGVIENFRNQSRYALPPIEIIPPQHADIFDTTVKYDDSTEEICPGRFSASQKKEIEEAAKLVHEVLGLSQYSRSDFIVADDGLYFLEVNTLPGLTPASLFPKSVEAVGGTYKDFITHLVEDARERRR